jgi:hypothetical protein
MSLDKEGFAISNSQWRPAGEFKAALNSLVEFLKTLVNFGIWLVVYSPLIIIPAVIVLLVVKKGRRKEQ